MKVGKKAKKAKKKFNAKGYEKMKKKVFGMEEKG